MKPRTIQILSLSLFGLLVVWGLYTLIYYVGVPYHAAALMSDSTYTGYGASCGDTAYFCKGISTLEPAFLYVMGRAAPFLWYGIVSAVLLVLVAGWQWIKTQKKVITIVWSPWKILLLFIASAWLFSTVISTGTFNNRPELTYVEPTKNTYNVSEQALGTLQQDYQSLLARGCLSSSVGTMQTGENVYNMQMWCIEESFVTRVLTQVLFIFLLFAEFLILGRTVLHWMKFKPKDLLLETLWSAGMGASVLIMVLWLIAVAGIYVNSAGWIVAIAIPIIGYKHARYWLDRFLKQRWIAEYSWTDIRLVLGWLLLSYLALNFLEVVRPFPIGWDDLGSYLNRPRLLVSYGQFIPTMSPFDWAYLTSIGFLLFGYGSSMGATASMMVNWSAGVLAVVSIIAFVKTFMGKRAGLLTAVLYYTLPLVGHFSFADMKIDNAVFFFGAAATLAVLLAVMPEQADEETPEDEKHHRFGSPVKLLILAGIFSGIAFATKSTAIMVILPLGALMAGILLGWPSFLAAFFLTFFIFSWQGVFSIQQLATRVLATPVTAAIDTTFQEITFAIGLCLLVWTAWRKRASLLPISKLLGAFALGLAIAIVPWMEHNSIETGWILPHLALGAPNRISPEIHLESLKDDLKVDLTSPFCQSSGVTEELDRYWGFDKGWSHYLTLPWRAVMNLDATGYYVTTIPALLLFPLLMLLPYFWSKKGKWLRWLFWITSMMIAEWIVLANGIPWYGVGILLGMLVALEAMVEKAPDRPNRIIAGILVTCSIFISLGMRLWQFEQQANIFEYSMGKISADALREITIPYYDGVSATVVDRHTSVPGRPYLYRVGTFIPYFIPKNLEIIGINDHQLDVFNCLYQERDPALTVKRLKALGFNSIIFDTNTATIERDPNGSLHKKVDAFVEFVNNPKTGLQVLFSDTNAGLAFILIPMTLIAVIPAYNEGTRVGNVIRAVQQYVDAVIVVDDGSSDDTGAVAEAAGAKVIRHPENSGAGAATMTGIEAARRMGATSVVTLDADEQHDPADIPRLLEPVKNDTADIVFANRFGLRPGGKQNKIPGIRRIFNGIGNIVTLCATGRWVQDSQSGYKVFGPRALAQVDLRMRGFEFCTEIIRESVQHRWRVAQVPAKVIYSEYTLAKGQSFGNGVKTAMKILLRSFLR